VKQEEYMFNWSTKIHIPSEIHYETWINMSAATLDPFAPNARNKYRNVLLVMEGKKMKTFEFKIDDDTPKKRTPTSVVSITPVTPPTASKEKMKEEEDKLIQSYVEESDEESEGNEDEVMELVEEQMLYDDCGEDLCIWEQHGFAIFEYPDSYLPMYQPWVPRERQSYSRKCLYRKAAREIFRILGHAQRKKFARRVIGGVRAMYPDPQGKYLGRAPGAHLSMP
jgi:hypothetical protein